MNNLRIAVASGKGGTGKTFLATNIFHVLARRGEKVTLVDCDAEAPDDILFFDADRLGSREITHRVPVIDAGRCTLCGRCSEWCHFNAIFFVKSGGLISVLGNLCHGCGACMAACNDNAITEINVPLGDVTFFGISTKARLIEARMRINEMSPVKLINDAVKEAGDEGVVIFDAPPGTSCPFVRTVDKADFVILVAEPTPFGLSDLRQSVEVLRIMKKDFGVVINRSDIGDDTMKKWLTGRDIPILAEIGYSDNIARSYSEGKLVALSSEEHNNSFDLITDRILQYGNSSNKR